MPYKAGEHTRQDLVQQRARGVEQLLLPCSVDRQQQRRQRLGQQRALARACARSPRLHQAGEGFPQVQQRACSAMDTRVRREDLQAPSTNQWSKVGISGYERQRQRRSPGARLPVQCLSSCQQPGR